MRSEIFQVPDVHVEPYSPAMVEIGPVDHA